jgi:hypothetical protein
MPGIPPLSRSSYAQNFLPDAAPSRPTSKGCSVATMFFIASIVGIPSILACVYWWYRSFLVPNTQRPTIACDMDEVLCDFLGALVAWHNATYGTTLSKSDFKSYQFHDTWGGTLAEGVEKVDAFFQPDHPTLTLART